MFTVVSTNQILLTKMGFEVKNKMEKIKTKIVCQYPRIYRKINRFDIVTSIFTFLTLSISYQSMFSSFATVVASHMSDEDNGKQLNVF